MVPMAVFSVEYRHLKMKPRSCVAARIYNRINNNSSPLHPLEVMKIDLGKDVKIKL